MSDAATTIALAAPATPEVTDFIKRNEEYRIHSAAASNLELDVRIAERNQDEGALKKANAALAEHQKDWHVRYNGRRTSLEAALRSVGIEPTGIKYIL